MELRHLRYFVAVAEEGSLTLAAERRLHTAQPSLSRQMRDLEIEVGAQLMTRSARGIELTAAGRALLDHGPRLALAQVEAAALRRPACRSPRAEDAGAGISERDASRNELPAAMHVLREGAAEDRGHDFQQALATARRRPCHWEVGRGLHETGGRPP